MRARFSDSSAVFAMVYSSEIPKATPGSPEVAPNYYGLKVVVAVRPVMESGSHTAVLETGGPSRTGRDLCDRVFRAALCHRERRDDRASRAPRRGSLSSACYSARKQGWSALRSSCVMAHLLGKRHLAVPGKRGF